MVVPKMATSGGPGLPAGRHLRHEGRARDRAPVGAEVNGAGHVDEQDERQPLERARQLRVAKSDGGDRYPDTKEDHEYVRIDSGDHVGGVGHSGQIGADVDGVRHQQGDTSHHQDRSRDLLAQRRRQPLPGHHSNAGAHHLNRGHEGPGQQRGPEEPSAELRADDRIGCDARRVVVGRPRDHAGTERGRDATEPPLRGRRIRVGEEATTDTSDPFLALWLLSAARAHGDDHAPRVGGRSMPGRAGGRPRGRKEPDERRRRRERKQHDPRHPSHGSLFVFRKNSRVVSFGQPCRRCNRIGNGFRWRARNAASCPQR